MTRAGRKVPPLVTDSLLSSFDFLLVPEVENAEGIAVVGWGAESARVTVEFLGTGRYPGPADYMASLFDVWGAGKKDFTIPR